MEQSSFPHGQPRCSGQQHLLQASCQGTSDVHCEATIIRFQNVQGVYLVLYEEEEEQPARVQSVATFPIRKTKRSAALAARKRLRRGVSIALMNVGMGDRERFSLVALSPSLARFRPQAPWVAKEPAVRETLRNICYNGCARRLTWYKAEAHSSVLKSPISTRADLVVSRFP